MTTQDLNLGDLNDVDAVHAVIRHLYDLPNAQANTYTSAERLVFSMNVFIVADKYSIAGLRQ
jgi:hypothetical protein